MIALKNSPSLRQVHGTDARDRPLEEPPPRRRHGGEGHARSQDAQEARPQRERYGRPKTGMEAAVQCCRESQFHAIDVDSTWAEDEKTTTVLFVSESVCKGCVSSRAQLNEDISA